LGAGGRDFYEEPIVIYIVGLQTVFVMDPQLTQDILLDGAESHGMNPIDDHVRGEVGGKGLLIAEDECPDA
jgi:hypothetical protein